METLSYLFIGYCDRSGSTFLMNELNKIEGVVVCPELDLLVRTLLKYPQKELSQKFLNNFRKAITVDKKFLLWDISIDSTGCKNRIDLFFKIINDFSRKNTEKPRLVVFKERSILEYYKELNEYSQNVYFVSLIRDPRAIFASQKRTINISQNRSMSNNALTTSRIWNRHCNTTEKLYNNNVNIHTLTYEELIDNTETTIKTLYEWIEKSDNPIVYKAKSEQIKFFDNPNEKHNLVGLPPMTNRIIAWKKELSISDISIIDYTCKDFMTKYKYEISNKTRINAFKYLLQLLLHLVNTVYWRIIVFLRKIRFRGFTISQ